MKYPISNQFFPFNRFTPPISKRFLSLAVPHMKPPKDLRKDPALDVTSVTIRSYDGAPVEAFLMAPKALNGESPCLVYYHGGGFVLDAAGYHYHNAMRYAAEGRCKVLFLRNTLWGK